MFFTGIGAANQKASSAADREKAIADARRTQEESRAKHDEAAAQLAALPSSAKPAELLALCEKVDNLGGVPAAEGERCGAAFFTTGRTLFASGKASEGATWLERSARAMPSKRAEVDALLTKAKLEAARQGAQESLKVSQAKFAASDVAGAGDAARSAQRQVAEALAAKPDDKPAAELKGRIDAQLAKVEQAAEAQAKAKRREKYLKESCTQLARAFGPESRLSDLQKEEAWKQYEGKEFAWDLEVVEVSSGLLGGYTVQFKCGRNSPSLIQDLQMSFPARAKSMVMQLQKGAVYEIEGRLKYSSTLLGMTAEPI